MMKKYFILLMLFSFTAFAEPRDLFLIGAAIPKTNAAQEYYLVLVELSKNGKSKVQEYSGDSCVPQMCEGIYGTFTSGKQGKIYVHAKCKEQYINLEIPKSHKMAATLPLAVDGKDTETFFKSLRRGESLLTRYSFDEEPSEPRSEAWLKFSQLEKFEIRASDFANYLQKSCSNH